MKHLILLFFLSLASISYAQDDSYDTFTTDQIEKSKKISETKLSTTVKFDSGMDYDGLLFWHVISNDDKSYYFNSTTNFTDVKQEEASYSSLMEYVIETIGF